MVKDDIKNLFLKLVSSNSVSNEFLEKFNSIYLQEPVVESFDNISKNNLVVGIYFLYLYNQYVLKHRDLQTRIEKDIEETVENFNKNKLSSEESKSLLENLIYKNMKYKVNLEVLDTNTSLLPFAQNKNTIEIEKMFQGFEKLKIENIDDIKKEFINYFDRFEKNKEYLLSLSKSEYLQSEDFNEFITKLIENINQKLILDSSSLDDIFSNEVTTLVEKFFENFKEKELKPIDFSVSLGQTLGDKNNESYFFTGNEAEELEPLDSQPYIPNLEMNSKLNQNKSSPSPQLNLWDMVGSIVVNPVKEGIGIVEYPYEDITTHNIYLAVKIEQEIDLSESENFYHQIQSMRVSEISDKTENRRQLVVNEISESLDIPSELALYPSVIEEYLARNKGVSIDFEIQKKKLRTEFYLINDIVFDQLNGIVTIPDDLEPITRSTNLFLYPSPKLNYVENKNVSLANERAIGKSANEFQLLGSWYISIELDLPTRAFLDKVSIKIRSSDDKNQNNFWKLQFTISKVLDIFEAESLLIENLWKYIWYEKIPIFPFDVRSAFLAMVPSGSVNKDRITEESIQLARGVEINHFDSVLKNDPYIITSQQKITIGKALTFYVRPVDQQVCLLYCDMNEVDILKKMNRDSSQNSIAKLTKRVSKALSLRTEKQEIAMHPKYLLTYLLFYSIQFNTQTDFNNLGEVLQWLKTEFEIKEIPIQKVKLIDVTNFIIEVEN